MEKYHHFIRFIVAPMLMSPSMIGRELHRNRGKHGYCYKQAHALAYDRYKQKNKHTQLTGEVRAYLAEKVGLYWSHKQVAGCFQLKRGIRLCAETVYRFVWPDKAVGGSLYHTLRHQHKPHKKRYGQHDYRGRIADRGDVDSRSDLVDSRARLGDWEGDTVISKAQQGAIVSLLERKIGLYLVCPLKRKTADAGTAAIIRLLQPVMDFVHTITFDNGREFSRHDVIANHLNGDTYFAKPYHSGQRGFNENHNGFEAVIPKTMKLDNGGDNEVVRATDLMNSRLTENVWVTRPPFEVFTQLAGKGYFFQPKCCTYE